MKQLSLYLFWILTFMLFANNSDAQDFQQEERIHNTLSYTPMIRAGGIIVDGGGFIGPNFINSWKPSESFLFGLGIGFEFLAADEGTMTFLPAFLHAQYQPFTGSTIPYVFGDVGYSVAPVSNKYGGGLMFSTGAGISASISSSLSLIFDIGYRYQHSAAGPKDGRNLSGMGVNIGIRFD